MFIFPKPDVEREVVLSTLVQVNLNCEHLTAETHTWDGHADDVMTRVQNEMMVQADAAHVTSNGMKTWDQFAGIYGKYLNS